MLRKLLILFCGLTLAPVLLAKSVAEKAKPLYLQPEPQSKIIGAIKNTEIMVLLERQGEWAKVVDIETGMVGWMKDFNISSNVLDSTSTR